MPWRSETTVTKVSIIWDWREVFSFATVGGRGLQRVPTLEGVFVSNRVVGRV